ncbi:MAG: metallophosphoesterase family protein [Cyclobacteriaceae bacterium]
MIKIIVALVILAFFPENCTGQIERVWLTHPTNTPDKLSINWESARPGNAEVYYGDSEKYDSVVVVQENTKLHQVEISLSSEVDIYHYQVSSNGQKSADYTFKNYTGDELRVAVVADWQGKPNLDVLLQEDIHLLLTAGDNISSIHGSCGIGNADCIEPYRQLIDTYPKLFSSTPFMPVLGNHDREIRPRGKTPPDEPVYDIEASAFRRFFALPGDEWKWTFAIPDFDVRFVALDLNHITDQGNSWQTCHPFGKNTVQYKWYSEEMSQVDEAFVVTLQNEKNERMRQQENGEWQQLFEQGTAVVTGYGYFAERAVVNGFPYFNTSLNGKGDVYPDTHTKFLQSEDSYILLSFPIQKNVMTVEIKDHDGKVLDRSEWNRNQ